MTTEAEGPTEWWLSFREFGRQQRIGTHEAAPRPTPEQPDVHLAQDGAPRAITDPTAYGRRAINSAVENVRLASEGFRNHTLNAAAYSMGRLVAAGLLDEPTVVDAMLCAAAECGLEPAETRRTIASGLTAGQQHPLVWVAASSEHVPLVGQVGAAVADDTQLYDDTYRKEKARRQVKLVLDQEDAAKRFIEPPDGWRLDVFVAQPEEVEVWLLDQVLPYGSNVTLAAPYKTGKTTLVGELLRSLCDQVPFLGNHPVQHTSGTVALWDYEMTTRQHRRWMRELGVANPAAAYVRHMRGHKLDLLSDIGKERAVAWLAERKVGVWIIDPFARAYLRDENDNSLVTQWTDQLDIIKQEAGVHTLVMPVHTGRREGADVRARGATRLDDWPDVRWVLAKDADTGWRYFHASGRDVDVQEVGLSYDPLLRRLLGDKGGRSAKSAVQEAADAVLAVLPLDGTEINNSEIARLLGRDSAQPGNKSYVAAAIAELEKDGLVANRKPRANLSLTCRKNSGGTTTSTTEQYHEPT